MLIQEGETNRVRIGSKILISSAESEPKFTDVGLKFDCKLNETAVLLDKATTIGVYDDAVSKRRYELRVTVTKAK